MNSLPYFLFLSLLLCRECRNIEGVKQNKIEEDGRVDGTDGTDLHKIFEEQARRNHPTTSATLTDEEEEKDLQTAPATGLKDDSEKGQDSTFLSAESGSRLSKDGTGEQIESEGSEISKNHKKRLTSGNPNVLEEKNRDSEKQDNNIRTGRKNNHENAESRRDGGSSHGNLIKDRAEFKSGHNKLAQRAQKGKAELESSSNFEAQNSPDSNLSKSTPPPFIKKVKNTPARAELDDIYFLFIVIGCSVAGIAGLALAGYCWYKLHTTAKAVSEAEYSGYGTSKQTLQVAQGDNKLDYSAEMYHYHQTKSQLSAMEKASGTKSRIKGETLEDDDDNSDEGDEEDFTVYECHGLAPTGDMTVVNPLFSDQEVVGSDQDGNGDRSGASGQGSPVPLRHSPKES